MTKKRKLNPNSLIPLQSTTNSILFVREQKVILDSSLANLYEVETKIFNAISKRNSDRFPEDFMFQLSKEEFEILKCHFGTSSQWGGRRYPPYAFTEQGCSYAV